MDQYKRLDLQLFAEGAGDGGAAGAENNPAERGENPADAGRAWLLENGAPAAKITPGRAEAVGKAIAAKAGAETNGKKAGVQDAAATEESKPNTEKGSEWKLPDGTTWEQIMSVPEFNQKMQDTVKKAKKDVGAAQAAMTALAPGLELLAKYYGLDPANLDHAELVKKIESDDSMFEAKALEMGVDVGTARQMAQQERQTAQANRQTQAAQLEGTMQQHYLSLVEQGKALAQKYPGFDLKTEMQNPVFTRLSSPALIEAMGGLEGVYEHVHRKELQQAREAAAAEQTRQQMAQTIQAGGLRPGELGDSIVVAAGADLPMTPERARQIAQAARRGEKITL